MNRRMKKKAWKEQTTAQQADLQERMEALEELTLKITAEQTANREAMDDLMDELDAYQRAMSRHMQQAAERRIRRERIRMEREMERRKKRMAWCKTLSVAAFAVAAMCFALALPAPEMDEPAEVKPVVCEAQPAMAMALWLEG